MAAATTFRNTDVKPVNGFGREVAATTDIPQGVMVCLDSSGYLVNAANTAGLSRCMGVSEEARDNNPGANGDKKMPVRAGEIYTLAATSITKAMEGSTMYVVDNQTFDDAVGNAIVAGVLVEWISNTEGRLFIPFPQDVELQAGELPPTLGTGYIPLSLFDLREILSNVVQDAADGAALGSGGILAKDTTPILERVNGATDKAIRVKWAASNSDEVQFPPIAMPPDLDEASDVTVHLLTLMGGATDTPAIDVQVFDATGDTEMGGNTPALAPTTIAESVVTLLAANIAGHPLGFLNIALIPGAHTTDTVELYGAWIEYTRK